MKNFLPIISHLRQEEDGSWSIQTNESHHEGVARLASEYASKFGMGEWGRLIGLLHDRGKERNGFQSYIRRISGYEPDAPYAGEKDHSMIGGVICHKHKFDAYHWMSNVIAGHHRGLYNFDELNESLKHQEVPKEVNSEFPSAELEKPLVLRTSFDATHMVRMLFSCLVDADYLDTENFMKPDNHKSRGGRATIQQLKEKLNRYCEQMTANSVGEINRLRAEIQRLCEIEGNFKPGFFDLTVPTGGGKTIASLVWALSHAEKYRKSRIIIAIPYTSIIVQTAETLRKIFGTDNVIEHHSSMATQDGRNKLASENWDAPIVVTTNVQLFESMYSNKPSKCRKLHSLCNSVVILDEAQSLPLSLLQPIVDAMDTYVSCFGVSFLFCTASQPLLDGKRKGKGIASYVGIRKDAIHQIVPDSLNLHDKFRRVELKIDAQPIDIEELAIKVDSCDKTLCVVNTRKLAHDIYEQLDCNDCEKFHLSRMMCPAHILETINEVKNALKCKNRKVKVVSTQLIEAGVDIDFPIVFRQLAGLDSILQAAGRCNREGKMLRGSTFVFQLSHYIPKGYISNATYAMHDILALYPDTDWFAPSMMREYFRILCSKTSSFDDKSIKELLETEPQFEQVSEKFKLIDDDGVNVIVNYGDAPKLVEKLIFLKNPTRELARQLGHYCVSVHKEMFNKLQNAGLIEEPVKGFYYISLKEQYDMKTGLKTENQYLEQTMII